MDSIVPNGDNLWWNLWNNYNEELKLDGFSVFKRNSKWIIHYKFSIKEEEYSKMEWKTEFDKKCQKWLKMKTDSLKVQF